MDILNRLNIFEGTKVERWWNHIFVELADPRTNDWFLMRNPIHGLLIIAAYLYFVTSWGPKFMANRKPFKMQKLLIVYNAIQVVVSCILVYEAVTGAYFFGKYSFKCEPVDRSRSPEAMRAARAFYWYFLAKISELLDTVFFVLRKKDKQISFLHLYHHTGMPMISWGCTKYFPGGHAAFIGMVNSMVHIVMYFYYFLSALGPQWQKYLWWKKYITTMQMIQFGLCFLHSAQLLWNDCGFPRWSIFFTLPNAIFFYFLFNDFYQKSYKARQDKRDAAEKFSREQQKEFSNGFLNGNRDSAHQNGKKIH
ncbi:very long chain fatty acid elongase AAEL008004-like [Culicoides brevitarsis]|uniref:very long chain fatty acid elongase AAEL008004-like n=1 Tax=Culicoides brevitarsis TaxID=469753 RepID=UPI00307BC429